MSSFITTQATQEVFELVLARPVVSHAGDHSSMVHLWWRAPLLGERAVQVYVDDLLYDVVLDVSARETMLELDRTRSHRIELLAVPMDDQEAIWRPQPGLLKSWQPGIRSALQVRLVRDEELPIDTRFEVNLDGSYAGAGLVWPDSEAKAARWVGESLVFDDASGLGLGIGASGAGPLGYDGTAWQWRYASEAGDHHIHIVALDDSGESVAVAYEQTQTIQVLPEPIQGLSLSESYNLTWEALNR